MWMFMLVMMVFTRTHLDEDSRVHTNLMAEGSATARGTHKNHRRKRKGTTTPDSSIEPRLDPHVEQSVVQHADPPKRRGPSINHNVTRTLQNLPVGSKIPLTMDKGTKSFIGTSATQFATECGIVVRNVCPMEFHTWDSVPEDKKVLMIEKLEGKFELLRTDNVFMEYVNTRLHAQWKRTRGVLSEHWKKNGGKMNPVLARANMKDGCRSQNDWNHLCDYWESEKTRKYSDQMELNRSKQVNISRGGSRSIANTVFQMRNPETQMPASPLDVYYKMHYNVNKKGWLNDHSRIEYENICEHKKAAMDKLISEGTIVTTAMENELEKEAVKSVCGRDKTIQSAWAIGVGPIFRKKDNWMKLVAGSSQEDSSKSEDLKNEVIELKEELKQSKDDYKKLSEFMSQKFPDFEILESTHSHVSNEDDGNTI